MSKKKFQVKTVRNPLFDMLGRTLSVESMEMNARMEFGTDVARFMALVIKSGGQVSSEEWGTFLANMNSTPLARDLDELLNTK